MSNEELVTAIQAGRRDLTEQLLAQNRGMVFLTARRYLPLALRNRGCGYDDLMQAASMGLLEAVSAWRAARGAFITIAAFYMRRACRALLGIHSTKKRIENAAPPASIYEAASQNSDGDSIMIVDTLPDRNAVNPCEAASKHDANIAQIVRAELHGLPPEQREVVLRCLMNREPLSVCAAACGLTIQAAASAKARALRSLRRNERLYELYLDYEGYYRHKGIDAFKSSQSSVVEDAAVRREKLREQIDALIAACGETDGLVALRGRIDGLPPP